jgi:hypothetical protein
MPISAAIEARLQCVAFAGIAFAVFASTLSLTFRDKGFLPPGRVLSRKSPSTPSAMYRSCQRHTHGFDLPVSRMIALVPWTSDVASTIRARQTALLVLLRSAMIASSRARFAGPTYMQMSSRLMAAA